VAVVKTEIARPVRPEVQLQLTPLWSTRFVYDTRGHPARAVVRATTRTPAEMDVWEASGETRGKRSKAEPRQLAGPRPRLLDRWKAGARIVYVTTGYPPDGQVAGLDAKDRRPRRRLRPKAASSI